MSTDDDPWSINKFSFAHLASRIGNDDQTPLTRPFTDESPTFHFTLPARIFKLRCVERPDKIDNHIRVVYVDRPVKFNYCLLLNDNNQVLNLAKLGAYDFDEIAPRLLPAIQKAFKDEGVIQSLDFLIGTHRIHRWTVAENS